MKARLQKFWANRQLWLGMAAGGLVGSVGRWAGFIIGLLLGHLCDELWLQRRADQAYKLYLDDPGASVFPEPFPGLAAFCALAAMVVVGESTDGPGRPIIIPEDRERVVRVAAKTFALDSDSYPLVESYVVQALARYGSLNIDLLAESLAFRRSAWNDGGLLADELFKLADNQAALKIAERVAMLLDLPSRLTEQPAPVVPLEAWRVLGLEPGTAIEAVKAVFRQLATQFHPDGLQALGEDRVRQSAEAFIKIESAYRAIMERASYDLSLSLMAEGLFNRHKSG